MPITPRPKEKSAAAVDVDALIARGGSVASETDARETAAGPKGKDPTPVVLRIPADLLERIEGARAARPVRIPRHTWLLEAVAEKLERDGV
ncbi:MAG: hypothetical protein H0U79_02145 [Solirubrobacterales bacterium]|nr:hypothetical protein [Solirubrobacterales bacterium]